MTPAPNGLAMKSMPIPSATANSASAELADELPARAQVEQVVDGADDAAASRAADSRSASSSAMVRSGTGPARRASLSSDEAARRRRGTRPPPRCPPPRGIGDVLTRRASGRSTMSKRSTIRRTSGRQRRGPASAATTKTATIGPRRVIGALDERSPAGRHGRVDARRPHAAGSRERGTARRSRGPRRRGARCAAASSRVRMASMMIRPTARISSSPKPRDVVAGVPSRMPRAVLGGCVVERDAVLVDRDPDLVEEVLGLLAGHAERRHVDEHQVVVRAAGDDARALGRDRLGEHRRVRDRPPLVRRGTAPRRRA